LHVDAPAKAAPVRVAAAGNHVKLGREKHKYGVDKDENRSKAYGKMACDMGQKDACDTKW